MKKRRTQKERRHSGRVTTKIYHPTEFPYEETMWDDWIDHRDGMRDRGSDATHIYKKPSPWNEEEVIKNNKKNKRYAKLRKAKKTKRSENNE